jgi:DNA-binding beta-propeller fold protein YncE
MAMRRAGFLLLMVVYCVLPSSAFALGQVRGSPFRGVSGPSSVAFSPDGKWLAVANQGRYRGLAYSVSLFSVNEVTGALSEVPASPVQVWAPLSLEFSPDGSLLVGLNGRHPGLAVFLVNRRTAALTRGPFWRSPGASSVRAAAFSPGGAFLAAADLGTKLSSIGRVGDDISVLAVDRATGALTPVPGSPFQLPIGSEPDSIAFGLSGELLATGDSGEALSTGNVIPAVSVFSVDRITGALTQVVGSPFPIALGVGSIAFSPGGALLAVGSPDTAAVSMFSVDGISGTLSRVPGSPFQLGPKEDPPAQIAFDPRAGLLAVGTNNDALLFALNPKTGALTPLPGSPFALDGQPQPATIAFSPNGRLFAVANRPHRISIYSTTVATRRSHP